MISSISPVGSSALLINDLPESTEAPETAMAPPPAPVDTIKAPFITPSPVDVNKIIV